MAKSVTVGLSYGALRKECLEAVKHWPGCESIGGIQIIRSTAWARYCIIAGIIPWLAMNKLQKTRFMMKVDDTLSVFSTHGVAGLTGGLLTGIFANPDMLMYIGTDKKRPASTSRACSTATPSSSCCRRKARRSSSSTT